MLSVFFSYLTATVWPYFSFITCPINEQIPNIIAYGFHFSTPLEWSLIHCNIGPTFTASSGLAWTVLSIRWKKRKQKSCSAMHTLSSSDRTFSSTCKVKPSVHAHKQITGILKFSQTLLSLFTQDRSLEDKHNYGCYLLLIYMGHEPETTQTLFGQAHNILSLQDLQMLLQIQFLGNSSKTHVKDLLKWF